MTRIKQMSAILAAKFILEPLLIQLIGCNVLGNYKMVEAEKWKATNKAKEKFKSQKTVHTLLPAVSLCLG